MTHSYPTGIICPKNKQGDRQAIDRESRLSLLTLIQPGGCNREQIVALFAYIDDTGTHDPTGQLPGSEVAGAVGYVGKFTRWAKLDIAWRKVLKDHGVKGFHAVDVRWRRGEFVGWTDDQAAALIADLSKLANIYTMFGVGGLLLVKDYAKLPKKFRDEVEDPYFIGLHNLFQELLKGPCASEIKGQKINFVFDQQQRLEVGTLAMFNGIKKDRAKVFGQITFGDKKDLSPLQCADLLAYNVRADLARLEYKPQLDIMSAMKELKRKYRLDIAYSNLDGMRDLFFRHVIQKASGGIRV